MTSIFENIALAIAGLRSNKMRALLTMLGIIIGISAVITITTLGNALQNTITSTFNELGANSVILNLSSKGNADSSPYITSSDMISDDMLTAYKERFADRIDYISLTDELGSGIVKSGFTTTKLRMLGVTPGTDTANAIKMESGHFINEQDVNNARHVVNISDTVAEKIFKNVDPIGQKITVSTSFGPLTLTVVGVYRYEINAMLMNMVGSDVTTYAYFPVTLCRQLNGNETWGYYNAQVGAAASEDYVKFAEDTKTFFNRNFYNRNPNFEIDAFSMQSQMEQMNSVMGTVQLVVAIVAAISLLVGGIGVMNIMLVSVTERTKEIGVRKALGAPNSAIRIQFIVESMIICLIGGIIGITLGLALGALGASIIGSKASASVSAVVIAVTFSLGIGIFFGYYPANKAAKLDPIEALRYE